MAFPSSLLAVGPSLPPGVEFGCDAQLLPRSVVASPVTCCAAEPSSPQATIFLLCPVSRRRCLIAWPLSLPFTSRWALGWPLGKAITADDPCNWASNCMPRRNVEPDQPICDTWPVVVSVVDCVDHVLPPSSERWNVYSPGVGAYADSTTTSCVSSGSVERKSPTGPLKRSRLAPARSAIRRGVYRLGLLVHERHCISPGSYRRRRRQGA